MERNMDRSMTMTRRDFISGLFAAGAVAGAPHFTAFANETPADAAGASANIDPRLAVLIADVHIPLPRSEQRYRTGMEYTWIIDTVKREIGEILAMRPLPACVFCLGDVSIAFSEEREYAIAAELFAPLEEAGIKLVMTVGNHDLREPFLKHLGKWAGETPVPGRVTSVTPLPDFDFVMLDSLKEPDAKNRGKYDALTKVDLGKAQLEWFREFAAGAKRPFIVGAHHPMWELKITKDVVRAPMCFGFIHGHNHKWDQAYLFSGYSAKTVIRSQGLPSFGIDRDIGYALLRSAPEGATLKYVAKDYYFPRPISTDKRPPLWDDIVRDNSSRRVFFPFAK